jgi:fluoride ion exporter CrcB/FEX
MTGQFIDGLGKSVFTVVIALGSLTFGRRLARVHMPIKPPTMPPFYMRVLGDGVSVAMYAVAIPLYFILPASYRHQATAALLFSYPGTLTRYLLAITTNNRYKNIPIGTLLANLFGTTLLGVFFVLQRLTNPVSDRACSLLQGLSDGYCGCLTTVSTLAAEIFVLGFKRGSWYLFLSWAGGQLLLLIVLGPSLLGSNHVSDQRTCTFQ